ncbi:MAG: HAMP domain-containing histidine kinase, partial [Clostridia bacterium]|nr:HAMP domain-containing histidine kinase [Clostridia bacterium]
QSMGENVNNLTNGLNIAIDEATKSERMKTELITNVSHDLKTPLTSIITYTDLLKQCDIEDATANEYIGVLDEKSHRLKKLVEDLVEASKASSGNVTLNMVKIDVNELTEQIYGEYEDDLKDANLELKISAPEDPVYIVADGQKTYRILENLFSNVKKYAMPGSRVYLDIASGSTFASITMKNVAKDEMHFDVERLTDRFVQGEESRTNEGSGLGLSIAKSLTELQGGHFSIGVDGDLFKVTVALPKAKG